jgi:ATP-dependent Clp endopeptidase proteolytic subunit ClpP
VSKFQRDDIEKFFDYSIDISSKTLYIGSASGDDDGESGVDHKMAERVIKGLHMLDRKVENGLTIIMNNPGGDWYHGMAIYDAIKACQNHVTIKVFGYAMSMGSVILQAADERILAPHAKLMLHYGSTGYHGHSKNFSRWAAEEEALNKVMEEIYLEKIKHKKPRFNRKQLRDILHFDTFFTAEQTIEYNLADKIL